jgi:hypothetical protein
MARGAPGHRAREARDAVNTAARVQAFSAIWLLALTAYVFVGYADAPFHGDESMQIYMSHDYEVLVRQRQLDAVLYRPAPADEMAALDQELRIVNGTITKMTIGLAWDLAGYTAADLNGPWFWGVPDEWEWNRARGDLPGDDLLRVARLPSAIFTALSAILVFEIARRAAGNHAAGWVAALIYVTTPAVLLNGRRAMMEGSALCFSALVILVALLILERPCPSIRAYAALGVAGGLAVASKHTAVIAVGAAVAVVFLVPRRNAPPPVPLPAGGEGEKRATDSPVSSSAGEGGRGGEARRSALGLIACGLAGLATFLALTPAWWSDPLGMPARVLDERRDLLDQQIAGARQTGDAYATVGDRLIGLADQMFFSAPQYFEVPAWRDYIPDQIAAYDGQWFAGRDGGPVWGAVLMAASGIGVATLWQRRRDPAARTALLWFGVTALALAVLVPFAWQRYTLPVYPPLAILAGVGARRKRTGI